IVDAVGVTKSLKTESRPLERKKSVPMKDLLHHIMMGSGNEDYFDSAANRLARLNNNWMTMREMSSGSEPENPYPPLLMNCWMRITPIRYRHWRISPLMKAARMAMNRRHKRS